MKIFGKNAATKQLTADIEKLKDYDVNSDERKALIAEIDTLTKSKSEMDNRSNKVVEIGVKTLSTAALMSLVYAFDKSGILNKAVMSFVPKH